MREDAVGTAKSLPAFVMDMNEEAETEGAARATAGREKLARSPRCASALADVASFLDQGRGGAA